MPNLTRAVLTHESGLVVTREARVLPDFNAVEHKLYFNNAAKKMLSPVSEIEALNLSFGEAVLEANCVVSSAGGPFNGTLPP